MEGLLVLYKFPSLLRLMTKHAFKLNFPRVPIHKGPYAEKCHHAQVAVLHPISLSDPVHRLNAGLIRGSGAFSFICLKPPRSYNVYSAIRPGICGLHTYPCGSVQNTIS